jgi:predicted DNA-binding protein
MAGIQIDGVNNKIDFDDDADTSISSATDDTLVIESGGVNVASITSGEFAINEGSGSIDFRVESDDDANMLLVDASGNSIGVGTNSPALANGRGIVVHGGSSVARVELRNDTSGAANSDGMFLTYSGTDAFVGNREAGTIQFWNNGSERMRIDSSGNVLVAKTSASGGNTVGIQLQASGQGLFTRDGGTVMNVTRNSDDGELIKLIQDGSLEGTISVSGTTVTYGGFTGTHWSRLSNNSKPTILRGTIVETIDEMCDWYQAVADVAEVKYTAEDQEVISGDKNVGDVKEKAHQVKENIALPDGKSVGDAVTFTSDGTEYTGTIVKEDDVKHTKCKVSDTADSKKVYGVFSNWDDADDGLDGDVNDMEIAQVGTYIIRVNKDVTVEAGDLLVSNGDGTAKVQDDDIIRSKTVAKVNSNIKVETYSDGSYTVPCTLHC